MATTTRNRHLEPIYKENTVVNDLTDVVREVEVTTGAVNKGVHIGDQIEAVEPRPGVEIATVNR